MIPIDRRPANEAVPPQVETDHAKRHGTLPPPEWATQPEGKSRPGLGPLSARSPRGQGSAPPAEEATLRARIDELRAGDRDPDATRRARIALARWLASRDRDLDEAVEHAEAALAVAEDVELRRELSSWQESLGDSARAAAVLKPIASMVDVESQEAAYVLVRSGVLQARAGLAVEAAASFGAAAAIDPSDPLPPELLAGLSSWPEGEGESNARAVAPQDAADAYVEAARRRAALQQVDAELEDLWRAVDADPASEPAHNELVSALEARGRLSAADEVRRARTRASDPGDRTTLTGDEPQAADPKSAQAAAALADRAVRGQDREAAASLERAIALVGPRTRWCAALADALEALGDLGHAVNWTQRLVTLRPGDRGAIDGLLQRLVRAGDPSRLGDALAWLLTQPLPVAWIAAPFGEALRALARTDADRAAVVARRTLDVLGPRLPALRGVMSEVASLASDDAFAAAILERWLASGATGDERLALFVTLADLRRRLGDDEARARLVARAMEEGVASPEMDAHLAALGERPATPDGHLWRLRARAARLATDSDREASSAAWRELGAALWDLADDRAGALGAWRNSVRGGSVRAYASFATDLLSYSGPEFAFDYLAKWVAEEGDGGTAAAIATGAARVAIKAGEKVAAFDFASRAVARCPLMAEALEVAERAADSRTDLGALSGLYDLVAERSFGRFGRRAAHYRAARFFERRLESKLALKHACRAFFAVPSEGAGFHLLARAAERARDPGQAMQTVEQVAEAAAQPDVRTGWFLRAATLAGDGREGAQRRLDLLLRAATVVPSVQVIDRLRTATRDLLGEGPDEDSLTEARLVGALRVIGERLAGPDGARIAIACAIVALELFADSETGLHFVERAFSCDADVDEFEQLLRWGPALGLIPGARDRVAAVLDKGAFANVGMAALRLLGAMAVVFHDEELRARISVDIASREPDDTAAVVEADAAVRRVPALAEKLAKRVKSERRVEALCTVARDLSSGRRYAEAAALFERALELLDPIARPALEVELRAAWDAAGRGAETEARVQLEAVDAAGVPAVRADHWMEIATRREARADLAGAVKAVVEACRLDPEPLERWSALERIADLAGDAAATVEAMEAIAVRVDARGRVAVFKRLAPFHERCADPVAAEHAWRRVLLLDPNDEDADHAVESIVAASGRFEELAEHLRRRADRLSTQSEKREVLRAVRLRLAAILEQRLGRVDDACEQLGVLLAEWPDNPGALRYLADLLDRHGDPARAAPLWSRAAAVETDPAGRSELEVKAGWAALAAGDLQAALLHVNRAGSGALVHAEALALRVEIARAAGSDRDLGDALEAMAAGGSLDGMRIGDLLLEAAQAAARAGDSTKALERACRAADAVPARATPQLLARGLEYRLRGPGTPEEARRTIDNLSGIGEALQAVDAALRSFLLAEALDVAQGGGAGLRELEAARGSLGDHPLIALGLAERFAAQGLAAAAVEAYDIALGGSLLDLRKASSVALAAGGVAIHAHRWQDAARFLDLAEADEETRAEAQAARVVLIEQATAETRPAVPLAPPPVAPPVEPGDPQMAELEAAVRAGGSPVARASARLALGRMRLERGDVRGAEQLLWEALADGLAVAGDVLAPVLASAPDRARDLVRLRRQQVALEPGERSRLEALRAAALGDDDRAYAAAVEHVLRAFDPTMTPLAPPPLSAQPQQPGIFALLTRPSLDSAGEALAAIWEGAMHLFVKDAAAYGIAGVERIAPNAGTALGRLFEVTMRVLDLPRIPVYVPRPTAVAPTSVVAVLSPPSIVLSGEVREESLELRFALGYGLAATLPQNVLRLGLPRADGRALIEALHAAFGPPEIGRRVDARAARLAQSFWQSVPSRTQRRLQTILGHGPLGDYEDLVARGHQSGLRAGMFLAGDFGWAARRLLAESSALAGAETRPAASSASGSLRALCDELPMLADLLRLAVSPEYADARWHAEPPGSRPATLSSKGYRFF